MAVRNDDSTEDDEITKDLAQQTRLIFCLYHKIISCVMKSVANQNPQSISIGYSYIAK